MTRIERLLQQVENVEQMLVARLQEIETVQYNSLIYQIESVHQKVRLAEKRCQVKNECSYFASVNPYTLIQ